MVHSSTTKILLNKGMIYCTVRPVKSEGLSPDNADDTMNAKLISVNFNFYDNDFKTLNE